MSGPGLAEAPLDTAGVDLSVRVGGVRLRNPLLTASGTFGYGVEYGTPTFNPEYGDPEH